MGEDTAPDEGCRRLAGAGRDIQPGGIHPLCVQYRRQVRVRAVVVGTDLPVSRAAGLAGYAGPVAALRVRRRLLSDDTVDVDADALAGDGDAVGHQATVEEERLVVEERREPQGRLGLRDRDLDRVIDIVPDVKQRIRELTHETGVTDSLPEDWTLQDLETAPLSELTGRIGDS